MEAIGNCADFDLFHLNLAILKAANNSGTRAMKPNIDGGKKDRGTMTDSIEEMAKKRRAAIIEIQSAAYDKATAYTNLIIAGGYAGAFAIWGFTKDQLPPKAAIWAALLLGVSLASFVFFEVYKMIYTTRYAVRHARLLQADIPDKEFLRRHDEIVQESRANTLKTILFVWVVVMVVCVGSAVGGLGLLFYNFVAILVGWPLWPCS